MKYLIAILFFCFLICCKSDNSKQQFYKARTRESAALLTLKIEKGQFYGRYKVQYKDNIIDSGEVRGVVIGDTLRGRFAYTSYGGSWEVKPFLLLKRGDTLKLGTGVAYTYLKIPYYIPKSIAFKDSSFQFLQTDAETYKALNLKMK